MLGTAHDEATPLLGRLEEQKLLTLLLDDVAMYGQALVLHGEPGIGESRLLSRSRAAGAWSSSGTSVYGLLALMAERARGRGALRWMKGRSSRRLAWSGRGVWWS
jgi:hypothetical protein